MLCAAIVLLAGAGAEQVWAQPAAPVPQGRAAAEASGFALKKRIAVLRVDAGGLGAQYGDVGNAIAAQLTTALFQTGQFVVIERAELAAVLREQEMGEKAITAPGSATRLGGLLGAQLLVRAVVTEFDLKNQGSGVRIGVGGANLLGGLGVAANTGVVALDVRLIDAATGAVTQTQRVEAKMESRGASVDLGARGASIGGDTFEKTPLGQATREAIDKAVAFIVGAAKPVPWTALVADVAGDQVFVNAGAAAGLRQGDVLAVSALVRQLTDPGSGEVLGTMERPSGQVEIVEVQERFSVARMLAPFEAKRGDYVRPAAR
jgi:curli biogenesis system outer membrane secretion channel CsgG